MRRFHRVRGGLFVLLLSVAGVPLACGRGTPLPEVPVVSSKPISRQAAKDPGPVEIELLRAHYVLRADGTFKETLTQRYRILDTRGVDNWGHTLAAWSPWYMNRPEIQATIESPGGKIHRFDPSTLAEQPAYPEAPDIYGDSRVLRAPLPNVSVGSVVEETIVWGSHKPFFAGGLTRSLVFQSDIARKKVQLIIDAPKDMAVAIDVRDAEVEQREEDLGDKKRIVIEGGPFVPLDAPEGLLPPEATVWPHVSFSTGRSWQSVARAYSQLVESKLEGIDFGPTVEEATDDDDAPPVVARKLLAWIKGRVRYAAIEFGDSGIVPRPPSQTVTNGYGDCKDQATLLVGLLRAAGIDAKVALLRAGTGSDVAPKLPTLDVFNHAIVVALTDPPLWIDPTADLVPLGELPVGDQNRLALVVDDESENLVRTPVPTPATNTYEERRVVHLAEQGPSRVEESSTGTGWLGWQMRDAFSVPSAKVREFLEDYVKRVYSAKAVGRVEQGAPDDIAKPFRVLLEARKAESGSTDLFSAATLTGVGPLLSWLPNELTEDAEEKRKNDLVLPVPYRAKLVWEVHPPKGFVASAVPNDTTVTFGPAKLVTSAKQRPGGSVEVHHAFNVGKARMTPAEVEAFRKGIKKWLAEPTATLTFKHRASALLDEGELAKGIALLRDGAKGAPKQALPRLRLAAALSDAGFGDVGRAEARKAVALAPNDPFAHKQLGHLLSRDDLGRYTHEGFERKAAIDAYRRAAELDEDDIVSRLLVGFLLEYDDQGNRYGNANLLEACEHYDSLDAEEVRQYDGGSWESNVLWCLYHAEQYEELQRRIRSLPLGSVPASLAVMGVAAHRGATAAVAEADRLGLDGPDRAEVLDAAARQLFQRRKYKEASQLLSRAHAEGSNAVRASNQVRHWEKLRPVDARGLKVEAPQDVLLKLMATYFVHPEDGPALMKKLVSPRAWNKAGKSQVAESIEEFDTTEWRSFETSAELLGDMLIGGFDATVRGDDRVGYHVRATVDYGGSPMTLHAYVLKEGRSYRLRALEAVPELGAEALYAVTHGKKEQATQWLNWARERWQAGKSEDPLRLGAFIVLWDEGKGDARLAAAALAARGVHAAEAIALLKQAFGKETDTKKKTALALALAGAYAETERWTELLSAARPLLEQYPKSDIARRLVLRALWNLDRFDEHAAVISEGMKESDKKRDQWKPALASSYSGRGDFKRARAIRDEIIADGKASGGNYNDNAWLGLFLGTTDKDVEHAMRAVQMGGGRDASALHTLACVYADLGRLGEAQKTLEALLEQRKRGKPKPVDYYIIGRIAEGLGLGDAARAAYKKVEKPEKPYPTATYELARRRLAKL